MKYLLLFFFVLVSCKQSPEKKSESKTLEEIHNQAIFVDTHNDVLTQIVEKGYLFDTDLQGKTHSDLKRMKEGGLDVQGRRAAQRTPIKKKARLIARQENNSGSQETFSRMTLISSLILIFFVPISISKFLTARMTQRMSKRQMPCFFSCIYPPSLLAIACTSRISLSRSSSRPSLKTFSLMII